jgi:hypothetical protein
MTNLTYIDADTNVEALFAEKMIEIALTNKLAEMKAADSTVEKIEIIETNKQFGYTVIEKPGSIFNNMFVEVLMPAYHLLVTSTNTGTTHHKNFQRCGDLFTTKKEAIANA